MSTYLAQFVKTDKKTGCSVPIEKVYLDGRQSRIQLIECMTDIGIKKGYSKFQLIGYFGISGFDKVYTIKR